MAKRVASVLGAVAFATASAALGAQAQGPPSGPAQPGPAPAGSSVTFTGCIERVGTGAGATFKLTKVERPAASASRAAQAPAPQVQPGPSARGVALDIPEEFSIKSTPTIDLNHHASHKVEVSGTINDHAPSVLTGPVPTGGRASAGQRDAAEPPELVLASLRMIAATCN
jgi:hypothetical protein